MRNLFIIVISIILLYYYTCKGSKDYYIEYKNILDRKFINEVYDIITNEGDWIYTTNIGNKKIKHNNNIDKRRERANNMNNNGSFSYSKYEYNDDSYIINKIKEVMSSDKVLNKLSSLTDENITNVNDIFISKFGKGDFLSVHNDTALGKYAFIIFLNKHWNTSCGGNLNIIKDNNDIDEVIPEYNKLILTDIYRENKLHYVDEVICNNNRYAITGWIS